MRIDCSVVRLNLRFIFFFFLSCSVSTSIDEHPVTPVPPEQEATSAKSFDDNQNDLESNQRTNAAPVTKEESCEGVSKVSVVTPSAKPVGDTTGVKSDNNNTEKEKDLESNRMIEPTVLNPTKEEELRQKKIRDKKAKELHEQRHPSRRMSHKMIILLSIVTCVAAVLMLIGQILGLFVFRSYGPIQYILHFYVFSLCILVVLVEWEWTAIGRQSFIFSHWLTRGLSYCFIGVLGLEENDTADWTDASNFIEFFVKFAAWFVIVVGTMYFVLGLFFVQGFYTRERKDYAERCALAKQLRDSKTATHPTAATTTDVVP
jgi:hypothetical protein